MNPIFTQENKGKTLQEYEEEIPSEEKEEEEEEGEYKGTKEEQERIAMYRRLMEKELEHLRDCQKKIDHIQVYLTMYEGDIEDARCKICKKYNKNGSWSWWCEKCSREKGP